MLKQLTIDYELYEIELRNAKIEGSKLTSQLVIELTEALDIFKINYGVITTSDYDRAIRKIAGVRDALK